MEKQGQHLNSLNAGSNRRVGRVLDEGNGALVGGHTCSQPLARITD